MTVGIYMKVELPDVKYTKKQLMSFIKSRAGVISKMTPHNPLRASKTVNWEWEYGQGRERRKVNGNEIGFDNTLNVIAEVTGVDKDDILGKRRFVEFVIARHLLFYLMYNYSYMNLKSIGRSARTDHTVVIHGTQSIANKISLNDERVKSLVSKIKEKLKIQ